MARTVVGTDTARQGWFAVDRGDQDIEVLNVVKLHFIQILAAVQARWIHLNASFYIGGPFGDHDDLLACKTRHCAQVLDLAPSQLIVVLRRILIQIRRR